MTQERKIVWEKWRDPYGADDEHMDLEPPVEEEPTGYIDEEESEQGSGEDQPDELAESPLKMVLTPMGAIPVTEYSLPGKIFNFWTGHTNFEITNGIQKMLETTPGVETLDIFTRYRFRLGIGKVFDSSLVKKDIQDNLLYVD